MLTGMTLGELSCARFLGIQHLPVIAPAAACIARDTKSSADHTDRTEGSMYCRSAVVCCLCMMPLPCLLCRLRSACTASACCWWLCHQRSSLAHTHTYQQIPRKSGNTQCNDRLHRDVSMTVHMFVAGAGVQRQVTWACMAHPSCTYSCSSQACSSDSE